MCNKFVDPSITGHFAYFHLRHSFESSWPFMSLLNVNWTEASTQHVLSDCWAQFAVYIQWISLFALLAVLITFVEHVARVCCLWRIVHLGVARLLLMKGMLVIKSKHVFTAESAVSMLPSCSASVVCGVVRNSWLSMGIWLGRHGDRRV